MQPNSRILEKWRDNLHIVSHPIRLQIMIMLYAAEVIERQKTEEELKRNYPTGFLTGFLKYYIKMIRSAWLVIRVAGLSALMYYLVVWPVKFFIYLKMGKGILMPFSVKK